MHRFRGFSQSAIHSDCWVEMLELEAGVGCCELAVSLGVFGISVVFPSDNFVNERLFVWNAALKALGR